MSGVGVGKARCRELGYSHRATGRVAFLLLWLAVARLTAGLRLALPTRFNAAPHRSLVSRSRESLCEGNTVRTICADCARRVLYVYVRMPCLALALTEGTLAPPPPPPPPASALSMLYRTRPEPPKSARPPDPPNHDPVSSFRAGAWTLDSKGLEDDQHNSSNIISRRQPTTEPFSYSYHDVRPNVLRDGPHGVQHYLRHSLYRYDWAPFRR